MNTNTGDNTKPLVFHYEHLKSDKDVHNEKFTFENFDPQSVNTSAGNDVQNVKLEEQQFTNKNTQNSQNNINLEQYIPYEKNSGEIEDESMEEDLDEYEDDLEDESFKTLKKRRKYNKDTATKTDTDYIPGVNLKKGEGKQKVRKLKKHHEEIVNDFPVDPLPDPYLVIFYRPDPDIIKEQILTPKNSSNQVVINGNIAYNSTGYSIARSSYPALKGWWYYEIKILPLNDQFDDRLNKPVKTSAPLPPPHFRLGWATEKAEKDCPVGFDKYGYSWRDDGTLFHQAQPYEKFLRGKNITNIDCKCEGYTHGDVLGFLIYIPEDIEIDLSKEKPFIINTTNSLDLVDKTNELEVMERSEIRLFKNGVLQNGKFVNLYKGLYYPAVSLYYRASVEVEFGPNFTYPPVQFDYKPAVYLNEEFKIKMPYKNNVARDNSNEEMNVT